MKRLKIFITAAIGVLALVMATQVWALPLADLSYTANITANHYTFTVDVKNNYTANLDYFQINLDAATPYAQFTNVAWNAGNSWLTTAVPFDPSFASIPAAVTADDSVLGSGGGGIAPGAHLGGFRFSFDYNGSLDLTRQLFSYYATFGTVIDPNAALGYSFAKDETGTLSYLAPPPPPPPSGVVPEPSTMLLVSAGLAGLGLAARRRNR